MSEPLNFSDIAPVDDSNFHDNMARMVKEPGLEHAVKYVLPDVDYPEFVRTLLNIRDKATFQHQIMWPFMEMMAKKRPRVCQSAALRILTVKPPTHS